MHQLYFHNCWSVFDVSSLLKKSDELTQCIQNTVDWSASSTIQLLEQKTFIEEQLNQFYTFQKKFFDIECYIKLSIEENDESFLCSLLNDLSTLKNEILQFKTQCLLNDDLDKLNAIIVLNAGAGGTESEDWCSMLHRMYHLWTKQHKFSIEILDIQHGNEAGLNSITLLISGKNAFGLLQSEKGIHRLIRNSPFNSKNLRQTSFVAVGVLPDVDNDPKIILSQEDLEITSMKSSGSGGQHVNKTESAIRIKHIPTNIVVVCRAERSQLQNKKIALKLLKTKLYELEKSKQNIKSSKPTNCFGNQTRNYVLSPYKQVKDVRTNHIQTNADDVLNGNIDEFIESYLIFKRKNNA